MNLHTLPVAPEAPPDTYCEAPFCTREAIGVQRFHDGYFHPDCRSDGRCPQCDGTSFTRYETYSTYQRHDYDTETRHEDWETRDEEFVEGDEWVCTNCGTTCHPALHDWIEDHR